MLVSWLLAHASILQGERGFTHAAKGGQSRAFKACIRRLKGEPNVFQGQGGSAIVGNFAFDVKTASIQRSPT